MSHQPDNIFAGTQVVSLVEVRRTNNSLMHPLSFATIDGRLCEVVTGQGNAHFYGFSVRGKSPTSRITLRKFSGFDNGPVWL